jgi:hypothetical protein
MYGVLQMKGQRISTSNAGLERLTAPNMIRLHPSVQWKDMICQSRHLLSAYFSLHEYIRKRLFDRVGYTSDTVSSYARLACTCFKHELLHIAGNCMSQGYDFADTKTVNRFSSVNEVTASKTALFFLGGLCHALISPYET